MRKVVLLLIAVMILFSAGNLQAGKKAGEVIGDSIFHDLKYGYSFKIPPGWEAAKIEKDKKILRVILAKKSPVVPSQFSADQSYFTEPTLTVLADSSDLSPDSILTLIRSQKRESDLIKEALKKFALVTYSEHTPEYSTSRRFSIGGYEGLFIDLRKEYRYSINIRNQARAQFVQDFIIGRIYILKDGPATLLIQQIAEKARYGFNDREFEAMIKSLDSGKTKKEAKTAPEEQTTKQEKPAEQPGETKDEKK